MCTFATLAVRAGGLRTLARPGQDILASGVRASVSLHPCIVQGKREEEDNYNISLV